MSRFILSTVFCLLSLAAFAGTGYYEWSELATKAYNRTINLRLNEAAVFAERMEMEEPNNLVRLSIENYIDFFKVYINENDQEFERLEPNKDARLERLEDEGDKSSPWHLYLQADIRLQWALARLKFEEYPTAFFETNKAFKLLSKNVDKFPSFMPNKKDLGILHAIVGTIPDNYKWAVEWISSMEGTIAEGKQEIQEVIDYAKVNDFPFEEEIYVFYSYLLLHLDNDDKKSWQVVNESHLDPETNPLAAFIIANVAMRTGRNDYAIEVLENRPGGRAFQPFYYLDYMLGLCKLRRLDGNADVYLQKYTSRFRGKNFIKDAYQKLAWHQLINSNTQGYRDNMTLVKSKGFTIVGGDKSALNEAEDGSLPDQTLLKARLLFDGGYNDRAYKLLNSKSPSSFATAKNQLEYQYRLGRIAHALGKQQAAINAYQKAIDQGRNEPWYYACRAALEMGKLYEEKGDKIMALKYYKDCQTIKPSEHRTGLHQQAKTGVNRVK